MQREIKFRVWNKDKAQWERHGLGMNSSDGALMTAKSRATLTPPLKSPSALISLRNIGIGRFIFRVQ